MTNTLGDFFEFDKTIIPPDSKENQDLIYLGLDAIESNSGRIIASLVGAGAGKSSTFRFSRKHILYGKLRPYLNKVALPTFEGRCTTEAIPIMPNDGVNREFLAYRLRCPDVVQAAMQGSTGSRMPRADLKAIQQIPFALPDINEQVRVAKFLSDVELQITGVQESAGLRLKDAKHVTEALFKKVFTYGTPIATKPFPIIPSSNWDWYRLERLARLESGHTPSRKVGAWWGGDIPWIALPDIRALDGKWATKTSEYTNPDGIANSAARVLPVGTVCLSRTASVGFVTIMGVEMATSQDFANWVCGPDLDPDFLMYALIASRDYLRSIASGATHQTIYMPALESFQIMAPPVEEQKRIAQWLKLALAEADAIRAQCETELKAIEAIPSALLRRVFGDPAN